MGSGISLTSRWNGSKRKSTVLPIDEFLPWSGREDSRSPSITELFLSISDRSFVKHSKYVQMMCTLSWDILEAAIGRTPLCEVFFRNLMTVDSEACALQCPRTRGSRCGNTPASLFVHIVHFMLKLSDASWRVKKRLRALGRKHVLYGIQKKHAESFSEAFLMTISQLEHKSRDSDTLRCWSSLLSFVTEQMFVERIHLVNHITSETTSTSHTMTTTTRAAVRTPAMTTTSRVREGSSSVGVNSDVVPATLVSLEATTESNFCEDATDYPVKGLLEGISEQQSNS